MGKEGFLLFRCSVCTKTAGILVFWFAAIHSEVNIPHATHVRGQLEAALSFLKNDVFRFCVHLFHSSARGSIVCMELPPGFDTGVSFMGSNLFKPHSSARKSCGRKSEE